MPDSRLIEVYRAENAIAATLIKNALEDAGIAAQITDDSVSAMYSWGTSPWWSSPRILVAEADAEKAAAILREIETARATRKPDDADSSGSPL
jgi:Putative prokaryotic signal transducing protein